MSSAAGLISNDRLLEGPGRRSRGRFLVRASLACGLRGEGGILDGIEIRVGRLRPGGDARGCGNPWPKAGDRLRIAGADVNVVSSDGVLTSKPVAGTGPANPLCRDFTPQEEDRSENARSVGVVVTFGRFSMLALGDLTWNKEHDLVCPN